MPSTFEPLPPPGSPSASRSFHDFRSGRRVFRLSRNVLFVAFLILNNIAWTYFYTQGAPKQLMELVRSPTQSASPVAVPLEHKPHPPPSAPRPNHHVSTRLEAIEIIMVMIGAESATEGVMTIKSAIMHSSRPLSFRLICSEDAIPVIKNKLSLFNRPTYSVDVAFYPLTLDQIRARAARAGVGTNYPAGLGGLVKVFLHELLPGVERAVFVDTDMIFVVDPLLLWNTFSTMKPKQMIAFPTLGPKSDASRICSCVMLLDLAAMRNPKRPFMSSNLLPSWPKNALSTKAFELAMQGDGLVATGVPDEFVKFDPMIPLYGDQGIYHIIWTYFPEYFAHLSLRWDVTHCRQGYGLKLGRRNDTNGEDMSETDQIKSQFWMGEAPEKYEQMVPGILHFNCQNQPNVWEFDENFEVNTWSSMLTMVTRYKWIWLNRGDGSTSVRTIVVEKVRFEDERLAEEERLSRLALEEGVGSRPKKARLDSV